MTTITKELQQYFETALWSSTDENFNPLDDDYGIEDLSDEFIEESKKDCENFKKLCDDSEIDLHDNWPHDFWLTRNHHGSGFWDGAYKGTIGDQLTDIAHSFGECDLYVGDDGKIYC